jgi:PleD family two-component response regulator
MIVVVDDQIDTAEPLVRLLHRDGLSAVHKLGARELLKHLEHEPTALIILDVMMPDMDGIECLERIRDRAEWADIPVVMYSADFSFDRMQEAKRLGAEEYVVKGTTHWDDFLSTIRKHIKASGDPS